MDDMGMYLTPEQNYDEALTYAAQVIAKIGLTLNKEKCKRTHDPRFENSIVEFVGIEFDSEGVQMDLGKKLAGKTTKMLTELDDLVKLHKVSKYEILQFLKKLVIPAVSYGAYTDSE